MTEQTSITCGICARYVPVAGKRYGQCLARVPELLVHRAVAAYDLVPARCRFASRCYKFAVGGAYAMPAPGCSGDATGA
jgi:hypothetical protein